MVISARPPRTETSILHANFAFWRNRDTLLGLRLSPYYLCPR
jgi:hypothetical protein